MESLSNQNGTIKPLLQRGVGRLPLWLKNKYFLTSIFFIVWMVFFDQKDLVTGFNLRTKLKELQKNEKHMIGQIVDTRNELNLLKTNSQTIEKYARENYMMKKDNEDLFIIKTIRAEGN